jgi:hypothetical protein
MANDTRKNENENKDNGFEPAFSVWNGRGKVAYSTYAKEDIHIPAGAKILMFRNDKATQENRQPTLNVVFVVEQ